MSYLDKNLLAGETIVFRTRLHWGLYVPPALFTLLVMVPFAVLLFVNGAVPWAAVPPGLGLVWIVAAHIRRQSSEFAVTNKRVVIKLGVFTTRSVELLPSKIEGVGVEQTMWGKLFGFGDIEVTGSGGTKERFSGIQSPFEFRRAIQQATDLPPGA
ncbi:MAG: PH domain-containing protein [Candidatus Eisenbacteria bacterium]|uniref:PH domain-containing protein n=1 Tax=Eiseniibacteriota bacterium TaxID=2212470 RepID=A0A933S8K2_UNCEI|nr:PH domain-containing protein [Candidatus Eisenbacteria bacterium]